MRSTHAANRRAFTLIELLVTLGIIVLLISLVIPVVGRVRKTAQKASVEAEMQSISAAIEQYHQTYGSYPGPLSDGQLYNLQTQPMPANVNNVTGGTSNALTNVTGTENLVLGLMGGLKPIGTTPFFGYDAALVGKGPRGLNPANPKSNPPLLDKIPLTSGYANAPNYGKYKDNAGVADDSDIPEILDLFPNPLPIIYLRAKVGAGGVVSISGQDQNGAVIGPLPPPNVGFIPTQYDLNQILAYTKGKSGSIGEGKTFRPQDYIHANPPPSPGIPLPHGLQNIRDDAVLKVDKNDLRSVYPYDAFPYFANANIAPGDPTPGGGPGKGPNATGTPKKKDAYILISAGVDRVYGTADDITNFGSVTE